MAHSDTVRSPQRRAASLADAAAKLWYRPDWRGWAPRLFEWSFTATRVGVGVRWEEETGVLRALEPTLRSSDRAADIGCGTGHYTFLLARRCESVVAIDPSPSMRRYVERRARVRRLGNIEVLPGRLPELRGFDSAFDVVVCVGVLQYVEDLDAAVASLARVVKPGGQVVFSVTPAIREARGYARQERLTRRQLWLRKDNEVFQAAERANLDIQTLLTFAGVTRLANCIRSQ